MRRLWVLVVATTFACASLRARVQHDFAPGALEDGAAPIAWQTASITYGFSDGLHRSWSARLGVVARDVPPLFAEVATSPYRFELRIVPRAHEAAQAEYTYFGADALLSPRKQARALATYTLPGRHGVDPERYARVLEAASLGSNIRPRVLKEGHFALFALVDFLGTLNAADDSIRRHAFGLLVLREKLKGADAANHAWTLRTPEETLADVETALRVTGEHFDETARLRSEVVVILTIVGAHERPQAPSALREQLPESTRQADEWTRTHHRPTPEEFGVTMARVKMPTPENLLGALDKDGYLSAAVLVAKSIVNQDPRSLVEAAGKLAPPNSSIRTLSEGIGAALRGDVAEATACAAKLGAKNEHLRPLLARVDSVVSGVSQLRSAAARPSSIDDATRRVESGAAALDRIDSATGNHVKRARTGAAVPIDDAKQRAEQTLREHVPR